MQAVFKHITVDSANVENVSTHYVKAMLAADRNYMSAASVPVVFTIETAINSMNVSAKAISVKYSKKSRTIKASSVYKFKKKAIGKLNYGRISKGSSKWFSKVNKTTSVITFKVKAPKKKAYTIKVKLTAAGDVNYKSATKTLW